MDNNAYQIYSYMTNHAISICSSKKQEHFRAIKELAVRKLFPTTQNQLTVNNGVKTKLEELTKLYNQLSEFFSQVSSYIVNYIKSNILKLLLHGVATYFNVGTPIALLIPHIPKLVRFVKLFFL